MLRENKIKGRTRREGKPSEAPQQLDESALNFLTCWGGNDEMEKKARSNGSAGFVGGGHSALGPDDLGRERDDIRRLATMTRGEALKEVLKIHLRGIFSIPDKCLRGGA